MRLFQCVPNQILRSVQKLINRSQNVLLMQIVDSITALFRVDFSGRGELAERQVCFMPFWLPSEFIIKSIFTWCSQSDAYYVCSKNWLKSCQGLQRLPRSLMLRCTWQIKVSSSRLHFMNMSAIGSQKQSSSKRYSSKMIGKNVGHYVIK